MELSVNVHGMFIEVSYIYLNNTLKTNNINTFQKEMKNSLIQ